MFRKSNSLQTGMGIGVFVLIITLACSLSSAPDKALPTPDNSLTLEPTSRPTSMPTSTPLPAYMEYQLPLDTFSLENANAIPPDDVISEVHYNLAGGGGGKQYDCIGILPDYPVASPNNKKEVEDKVDLLTPLYLVVCGWMPDEQVEVNVTTPAGDTIVTFLTVQPGRLFIPAEENYTVQEQPYYSEYIYYPPIDSLAGEYTFTFTGDRGGVVKYKIDYIEPTSPMAYAIYYRESEVDQNNTNIDLNAIKDDFPVVVLSGYPSQGQVRLFSYNGGFFNAWQNYQVNQDGRLLIKAKDVGSIVVIGGSPAVEIHPAYYPGTFDFNGGDRLDPIYLTCKDTIPTRLKIGDYAYVSTATSTSNRLRSESTIKSSLLDKLAPGTIMEIVDGPKCADGILWWKVKGVDRNFDGWTGEGDTYYWLEPCYSKDDCP